MVCVGLTRSRDWPLISLLFLQSEQRWSLLYAVPQTTVGCIERTERNSQDYPDVTFYNPIHKLIFTVIWMPWFCHIAYPYNAHFTKLYIYKSIKAESILKGKHFNILECKFLLTTENFSLGFPWKKSFPNWNRCSIKKVESSKHS